MKTVKELCRELRKNQTEAEDILWQKLRNRQLMGCKFLRQHPIIVETRQGIPTFFIADFYCAEAQLVIEVDGPIHELTKARDMVRDEVIASLGKHTLRFRNEDVMNNLEFVLISITDMLPV